MQRLELSNFMFAPTGLPLPLQTLWTANVYLAMHFIGSGCSRGNVIDKSSEEMAIAIKSS